MTKQLDLGDVAILDVCQWCNEEPAVTVVHATRTCAICASNKATRMGRWAQSITRKANRT